MNIKDLDLNLLIAFDSVYTHRNISAAANDLGISQPAMSNAVARLRRDLGDPLFVRARKGVEPTARADQMIGPVRKALEHLQSALVQSEDFDPAKSDHQFKLLIAEPMEPLILPRLAQALPASSRASVELLPPQTVDVETGLIRGVIDLAVFLPPTRLPDLEAEELCKVDLVMIVRADHPGLGRMTPKEMMAHFGHVALNLRPKALANSEKMVLAGRIDRHDVFRVPRVSAMPGIVAQSDLVALVPRLYALNVASRYGLAIIEPERRLEHQSMHLIWHRRTVSDAAQVWIRDVIRTAIGDAIFSAGRTDTGAT